MRLETSPAQEFCQRSSWHCLLFSAVLPDYQPCLLLSHQKFCQKTIDLLLITLYCSLLQLLYHYLFFSHFSCLKSSKSKDSFTSGSSNQTSDYQSGYHSDETEIVNDTNEKTQLLKRESSSEICYVEKNQHQAVIQLTTEVQEHRSFFTCHNALAQKSLWNPVLWEKTS